MRWLVEVTLPGTTEKEFVDVDAETWQAALQAARSERGEPASLVGFAFDVNDDGCRAIDPGSLARYDVRSANGAGSDVEAADPAPASTEDRTAIARTAPRPAPYTPPARRSQFPEESP